MHPHSKGKDALARLTHAAAEALAEALSPHKLLGAGAAASGQAWVEVPMFATISAAVFTATV